MHNYKNGKLEKARKLLTRSLNSLEKRDHLDVISKFAQMEFKFGEQEKGKNMFESVVANYSSRVEVWIVYLSMLIKYTLENTKNQEDKSKKQANQLLSPQESDAIESIRNVFERSVSCMTNEKKRVSLLKKYLDFERSYGNEGTVGRINQKLDMSDLMSSHA